MGQVLRFERRQRTFSKVPQGPWRVRVSRRRRLRIAAWMRWARIAPWTPLLALAAMAGIASVAVDSGLLPLKDHFALCGGWIWDRCVIDGDTIRYRGMTIRLAGIDAPETRDPKCASEAALGRLATRRLLELMNDGPFQVVLGDDANHDSYGRKLRIIMRDGRSLGDTLIAEGFARRWDGARRSWCG